MGIRVTQELGCIRIIAVIVLYKVTPQCSVSFTSLQATLANAPQDALQLKILLYDNTPGGQDPGELPDGVQYQAAGNNAGLAEAYNQALAIAEAEGYDWLLTLDQDTALPLQFLCQIAEIVRTIEDTPAIAAIVPQITGHGKILSPNYFWGGAIARWFKNGYTGVSSQATFAFNSASTIRVTALQQIGGYHPWFWLDNSDAYMFRQLHRHGKHVYVAGNIQVAHDFSMMDMNSRVTATRYRNILLAESAFWDLEMGTLAGLERTARLILRFCKHIQRNDSPELRAITKVFLYRRMFWTRKKRVAAWEIETRKLLPLLDQERFRGSNGATSSKQHWKLSVCIAAYNGERYVEEQLRSILDQLREHDEVIVVDDASVDDTKDRITSLNDRRIRLIEHGTNRGVVATFEDAVRNATGDIIFLADDDDIWAPNKVEKVLDAFKENPEAQIVTTRVAFIDQHGLSASDNIYSNRKIFRSGFWQNVLRNQFQGSAMAFRSSLLHDVLPFPKHVKFLHDHWIGTRNAIRGGSTVFIDEPLLFYRRHSHNFSRRMTRIQQVKVRLQLLWTHLFRFFVFARNRSL